MRLGQTILLVVLVLSTILTTSYAGEYRLLIICYKDIDACRISIGTWLRGHVSPEATVAVFAAGGIPFYSELKTIDMLGMTDPEIAHLKIRSTDQGFAGHEKFDINYTLSRKPDYIAFVAASLDSSGMPDISLASEYERALLRHQGFTKSYRLLRQFHCFDRKGATGVLFVKKHNEIPGEQNDPVPLENGL